MTTSSINVKTNALDSISTALTIGSSASTVNVGQPTNIINVERLIASTSVKQNIYYFSTQTFSPTVADFLANGTFIMSLYSSANPSTVNDIITVNLPTPTSQLDGCYFCFRKLRGQLNNSSVNWSFNTSTPTLLAGGATLTSSASPLATLISFNPGIQRVYVLGYSGSYYWTFA
jgi:hypothetical protein